MRKMGGVKKYMPITFATMLIATLAISGVPLLSGFFSKDEILLNAFASPHGSPLLWGAGILTAVLTAFYMFRLIFMTFYGPSRMNPDVEHHVHESPRVMTLPLIILAVLAIIGGYIGLPKILGGGAWFEKFLEPALAMSQTADSHLSHSTELYLMLSSIAAAALGIYLAYTFYIAIPERPRRIAEKFKGVYTVVLNKYYVDEFYNLIFVQPFITLSLFLWKIADVRIVDAAANGLASSFGWFAGQFRFVQSGRFRNYALIFVIGVVILMGFVFVR
jgi:NADH-quinone oxidoreductase subunit L